MNRNDIERFKLEFESWPESWRSFGVDLVDAGSPNPCNRSPMARKVLHGRWQEAYQDWLKAGEFSRDSEELMLAFILATEVTFHRRAPAPIPLELPRRIWDESEYQKSLRRFRDIAYWRLCLRHLQQPGKSDYWARRNKYANLLAENRPTEAEAFYREHEMDQYEMGEQDLAMAHMCASVHATEAGEDLARKPLWYFADNRGRQRGPLSEAELSRAFEQGWLLRTTYVWKEGMTKWEQAALVPAFRIELYSGALPPALP
jgi:GYF domain 2